MPPSWIMKLTGGWGEAKNDSKGEDDGFKMEEGEGEEKKKFSLSLPPPPPPLVHFLLAFNMAP